MHPFLSPSLRSRLSQQWSRQAEAYLLDDEASEVDAIWMPPSLRESARPAAMLHCQEIQADTQHVRVLAQRLNESTVTKLLLPMDEVVYLTHSSLAPLSRATISSPDPLLHTPGDPEAFRIRCLARVPPTKLISPTRLAEGIPGMRLRIEQEASPGHCACTFEWTPKGMVLGVEAHPDIAEPTESSVGLALAAWFCSRTPYGSIRLDWARSEDRGLPADRLPQLILSTYQALRLPSLTLFMVLRATGNGDHPPTKALVEALGLPEGLIRDRLAMLRSQEKEM